jgi:hypothetical protein
VADDGWLVLQIELEMIFITIVPARDGKTWPALPPEAFSLHRDS